MTLILGQDNILVYDAMKIIYSPHLEFRLKYRQIPHQLPRQIFETSKERYFDTATDKNIAIAKTRYKGKMREIVVAYERRFNQVFLITIHPLQSKQKFNRIKSGRWQPI